MSAKKTLSLILAVLFVIGIIPAASLGVAADPPESMTLEPDSIEGYPGEWHYVYPEFNPSDEWENVTWESSDESVVTFNSYYGEAYLVAPGTATLTATSESGLTATCSVTVKAYPTLTFGVTEEIPFGGNGEAYYSFTPEEDGWYRLTSSDNNGHGGSLYSFEKYWLCGCEWDDSYNDFTIDYQMEAGVTYLYYFNTGYSDGSFTVLIDKLVEPESIAFDVTSFEGYPTERFTLSVSYFPENAVPEDITWTSSAPEVASVNYYGRVLLLTPGEAVITGTTESGVHTECAVTVLTAPTLVLEETATVTIEEDEGHSYFVFTPEEDMTVEFVSYSDDIDTEGAILDSSGYTVNSSSYGGDGNNFKFTANLYEGETYYFRAGINWTNMDYPISFPVSAYRLFPAESLSFAEGTEGSGRIGDRIKLTPVFSPDHSIIEGISWNSSDDEVASVSWDGTVYLNKVGVATITATTYDTDLSATYVLTVNDLEPFVPGETKTVSLENGKNVNFKFTATEDGTYVVKAPSSDYYAYCYVKNSGGSSIGSSKYLSGYEFCREFKATAGEEYTITVYSGSSTPFDIDVTLEKLPAAEAIVLPESVEIEFGSYEQIEYSFTPDGCAPEDVTWTIDDESVATVSDGYVYSVAAGTATVTATTENGLTATCTVTVTMPPVLTEGEPLLVSASNYESQTFMFMPSESGGYSFRTTGFSQNNTTYIRVMTLEGWNRGTAYSGTLNVVLDGGEWYKVQVALNNYPSGTVTFNLEAAKTTDAEEIALTPEYTPDMYVGNGFSLNAETVPWNASASNLTWTSSDPSVATVTYYGYVSLKGVGTAVIRATDENGVYGEYTVTVLENPPIEELSLNYTSLSRVVGDPAFHLYAYAEPYNHKEEVITWTSSDPTVATVDQDGYVEFVGEGTATITATSEGGVTATCSVTVKTVIILTEDVPARVTIVDNKQETARFTPNEDGTYCIGISNNSNRNVVAYEASTGGGWYYGNASSGALVVDLEAGVTCSIRLSFSTWYAGDNGGSFDVTVSRAVAPASITVTDGDFKAGYVGSEYTFTVEFSPWNALPADITWTVEDPAIASVDEYGTVTFISGGETSLTASTESGLTATVTLRSVERPAATSIAITRKYTGTVGDTGMLSLGTVPEDARTGEITWTSSDPSVVTVNEDGMLTFISVGEATVTATTEYGLTASCAVTVSEPIELAVDEVRTVGVFNNNYTKLYFTPAESGAYKFRAFNPTGDGRLANINLSYNGGNSFVYGSDGIVGGALTAGVRYTLVVYFNSYYNTGTGTADVTVSREVAPESMTLSSSAIEGYVGNTFDLRVVNEPWNAWDEAITWTSSDDSTVYVNGYGNVRLLSAGEAVVTATSETGLTATATVTVKEPEPIALDEVKVAEIGAAGGSVCFIFTPEEDGVYAFTSMADSDTYGYVKNTDWKQLASNDDGGENNNFRVKMAMTAGTSYILEARYYSSTMTGSFNVTVTKAKVAEELSIVSLPTRTEYVKGFVSGALDLSGLQIGVRWDDGTSDVWSYSDGNTVAGETIRVYTTNVNAGYFTVSCDGVELSVPLDLIEDPVAEIVVEKGTDRNYFENADGSFVSFTDPITLETREVFRYNELTPSDAVVRIIYKDGTEKTANVGSKLDGYSVTWSSNQTEEPWVLGENALTVSYLGHEATLTVTVSENPVESIELISGSIAPLVEGVDGYTASYYDSVVGETVRYFRYSYTTENVRIRIRYKDGTEKEAGLYTTVDDHEVSASDDQRNNPWVVGSENPIFVTYLGHTVTLYATVIENPVSGIELLTAPTRTYYFGDEEYMWTYSWGEGVFNPDDFTGLSFRAAYTDGTSRVFTADDIGYDSIDGHSFSLTVDYPTGPNDAFPVTFSWMGFSFDYTVAVVESPIASLEVTKLPDNPNYTDYHLPDYTGMQIRITKNDGTVKNITVTADNSSYGYDPNRGTYFGISASGEELYVVRNDYARFELRASGKKCLIEGLVNTDQRDVTGFDLVRFSKDKPGLTAVLTYDDGTTERISEYNVVAEVSAEGVTEVFLRTDKGILNYAYDVSPDGALFLWTYGRETYIDPSGTLTFFYTYPGNVLYVSGFIGSGTVATIPLTIFGNEIGAIREGAFASRPDLTEIHFEGTRAQWEAIVGTTDIGIGGSVKVVCSDDEVPHEHSYSPVVTAPTCTEQGYTTHVCSCGASYVDTYTTALGHDFGDWSAAIAPTCTSKGTEIRTCKRCGATEQREIPVIDHDYEEVVTPATCTAQGYTSHVCRMCGASYVDTYTSALGHNFGEWVVTTAPTCTEKGVETRTCSRCGATEQRDVPAAGHDYEDTITPPTCAEQGYTTHVCRVCHDTYVDTYVRANGHNWGPWTVVTPATETEEGLERRVCLTDPEHVEERAIPVGAHVHTMSEIPGVGATCTADGSITYYVCTGCGRYFADIEGNEEINSEDTVIPALGHSFGEWTTAIPATCTEGGTEERVCSRCGEKETRPTTAIGHNYGATVTAPTCTEQGYTTHTCANCGDSYVDTYVAALGHNFGAWTTATAATCTKGGTEERVCSRCGEKETRSTEATGHDYKETVTAPTCTDQGYTTHTCPKCGDSYVDTYTTALGHDFGADGKAAKCARCGAKNPNAPTVSFKDVPADAYYKAPVDWAVANNITAGTGPNTFSPDEGCTRGQVVTFLWRAAGQPEPTGSTNPFKDVKSSDYFYKAVLWAVEKGVTAGTSKNTFSPNDVCTRGQIVTFLWRANNQPAPKSSTNPFKDVKTDDYFFSAVLWAVEKGITLGTDAKHFSPSDTCTRGQVVTFLYRDMG